MDARNEGHVLSFVDLFNCSTTNTIEYVYCRCTCDYFSATLTSISCTSQGE